MAANLLCDELDVLCFDEFQVTDIQDMDMVNIVVSQTPIFGLDLFHRAWNSVSPNMELDFVFEM